MAFRTVDASGVEGLPTVEEVMARLGLDRDAADLYLALKTGLGLVGDRVCIPSDQVEVFLREQEEAASALIAAMEQAAAVVDPAATVEENVARTGLDRRTIEVYLSLRRVDTPNDQREAE